MLSSSPGPGSLALRGGAGFLAADAPSSPSQAYRDGELSPTFDASFASSMSITSDERAAPSPLPAHVRQPPSLGQSSPIVAMDISPAPAVPPAVPQSEAGAVFGTAAAPPPRPPLFGRPHSQPPAPSAASRSSSTSDHPFLKSLFRAQQSAPPTQTTFPPIAPLSLPRSSSPDELHPPPVPSTSTLSHARRPALGHFATVPPTQSDKLRGGPFDAHSLKLAPPSDGAPAESISHDLKGKSVAPLRLPGSSRSRSALPSSWNKQHRSTLPATGGLQPPPLPLPKRRSDPGIPTTRSNAESSPFRMDIDGASPNPKLASPISLRKPGHPRSISDSRAAGPPLDHISSPYSDENDVSGASDRLADMFGQSPGDLCHLSPIPQSRKRLLDLENSPTPASPTPTSGVAGGSLGVSSRRAFEKAATTASLGMHLRRQRSAVGLGVNRRPSLASFGGAMGTSESASSTGSFSKRHATQSQDGKPAPAPVPVRKASRRSNSVADGSFTFFSASGGGAAPSSSSGSSSGSGTGSALRPLDSNLPLESPRTLAARASISTMDGVGEGYFGKRAAASSVDLGSAVKAHTATFSPENTGSPIAGFRKQEAKGKALPCFNVKEDGLMRISPETLNELHCGRYRDGIKEFLVIDCRFDYEYDGGHIDGAINLSEHADIEARLLNSSNLPVPSTSDCAPRDGKTILIFHCEFSAKRAPTSAKFLRNQDRLKNFAAYPNIHYPEVYVLQGGYEAFFKAFPERCVGGYVVMDHPEHDAKRSVNLNKFREAKRQFNRAASFTFGQAQHASTMLRTAEVTGGGSSTLQNSFSRGVRARKPLEPPGFQFPLAAGGGSKKSSSSLLAPPANAITASVVASTAQLSITEEDHEGDSSFGTNASGSSPGGPGAGGSPCPPSSKLGRHSLKLGAGGGMLYPRKMGLERAATASVLTFSRS
ncbi:hypothetical protein JCM8097_008776 [Rhodosporidiobolus ruineniae]